MVMEKAEVEEKLKKILEKIEEKKLSDVVFEWRKTYFMEFKPRTKYAWEKQVDRIKRMQQMLRMLRQQIKQYEE
jgi:hypothetical protein